jgi:glycosyltransferase involved in cell wall biosynthesis
MRIGYVIKMYPRLSETFIVNEILAHERAGLAIDIFSLRPPVDGRFHEMLGRVKAAVTWLPSLRIRGSELWDALRPAARQFPRLWEIMTCEEPIETGDLHQALVLAREVRARGITHLHAHFASSATTVARLAAKLADASFSFTAHAKDIFHESVDAGDLRRKLEDASAVVTVSDFNLEYLRATFGPAAARVRRIYNGLQLSALPFAPPVDRARRIIGVGRLIEKKGFEYLIDACAILVERGCEFTCDMIGEGERYAALGARIAQHGLEGRVRLLGALPQEQVLEALRESAVFAAPCVVGADGNRDGLPTVLLEAMAVGTPCVSTDVTGIPEAVLDGETGDIVPQHDARALAGAIERLLEDRQRGVRYATAARQLMQERFDIDGNTARMRELFATSGAVEARVAPVLVEMGG